MENIIQIMAKHPQIIIICDEVYSDIIFDNHQHITLASYSSDIFNRVLTVNSASKKFSVTGWKIGWVIGPENIIKSINYVTKCQNWCQPTPLQHAVAQCLIESNNPYNGYSTYWEWLQQMYQHKRDDILSVIKNGGLIPIKPYGSFFAMADITSISHKLFHSNSIDNSSDIIDFEISKFIAQNGCVTSLPVSAFTSINYADKYRFLRFSFCVDDDSMIKSNHSMLTMKQTFNL